MSKVKHIERVTVVGAGTMGHGIAQVAATAGLRSTLYDVDAGALRRGQHNITDNLQVGVTKGKLSEEARAAALEHLRFEADVDKAVADADLVIEAAPERLDLKKQLFSSLSSKVAPDTVLATNTSSLSVTEIAAAAQNPERVVGMHFFNPPYILKLLELVRAEQTSEETLAAAKVVGERMGRELVVISDSPGFATSRLGLVLGLEAIRMVQEGVASAADIDRAMELGYRHPMGPLKLTDLVGLDVRLAIAEYLHKELGTPQFHPPQLLRRMVRAGKLGKKTGQGFYSW